MGAMSDLHLLATRVLETDDTVADVAADSTYAREDIEWAVDELRQV